MIKNQNIVITGGSGMIGRELVKLLRNDNKITVLDKSSRILVEDMHDNVRFVGVDLCDFTQCRQFINLDTDLVFHLAGVKGSPKRAIEKPADFFVPMLQFNTNVLEAARLARVDWTLYTSSVGVYGESEIFNEDDMWARMPSPKDWYAAWAKRMGELQLDAYKQQYGMDNFSVVRPLNVYGLHDNFDLETCMVIPALIQRCLNKENPLRLFGSGKEVRDFVFARDVARAMVFCVENRVNQPVNVSSGVGHSIKEVAEMVCGIMGHNVPIEWSNALGGDNVRLMNIDRLKSYGFAIETSLADGIKEVVEWVRK